MNTTAIYRSAAYDAAHRCDYALAAELYRKAIEAYPPTPGQLAQRDLKQLRERMEECRRAQL